MCPALEIGENSLRGGLRNWCLLDAAQEGIIACSWLKLVVQAHESFEWDEHERGSTDWDWSKNLKNRSECRCLKFILLETWSLRTPLATMTAWCDGALCRVTSITQNRFNHRPMPNKPRKSAHNLPGESQALFATWQLRRLEKCWCMSAAHSFGCFNTDLAS